MEFTWNKGAVVRISIDLEVIEWRFSSELAGKFAICRCDYQIVGVNQRINYLCAQKSLEIPKLQVIHLECTWDSFRGNLVHSMVPAQKKSCEKEEEKQASKSQMVRPSMWPLADWKDIVPYLGQQWRRDKPIPAKEMDPSAFSSLHVSIS